MRRLLGTGIVGCVGCWARALSAARHGHACGIAGALSGGSDGVDGHPATYTQQQANQNQPIPTKRPKASARSCCSTNRPQCWTLPRLAVATTAAPSAAAPSAAPAAPPSVAPSAAAAPSSTRAGLRSLQRPIHLLRQSRGWLGVLSRISSMRAMTSDVNFGTKERACAVCNPCPKW